MHSSEASAREKVRRAEAHLADLHLLVSAYTNSHPYRVLTDPPGDRGIAIGNGHRVLPWHEPPPLSLSAVAGDVVTNLRAALDHIVWGLAKPKERGTWTAFPVHTDDSSESRAIFARRLAGVPKRAIKAIEQMQPHKTPGEPWDKPLAVLNSLVNEDKHRSLLTVRLAVPAKEFFQSFLVEALTERHPELPDLMRKYSQTPTDRQGCVVLADPASNTWEFQMEMKAPTVQVVTNAPPHREVLDALHELRVVVLQALDKLVGYLRDDEPPVVDRIVLKGFGNGD